MVSRCAKSISMFVMYEFLYEALSDEIYVRRTPFRLAALETIKVDQLSLGTVCSEDDAVGRESIPRKLLRRHHEAGIELREAIRRAVFKSIQIVHHAPSN